MYLFLLNRTKDQATLRAERVMEKLPLFQKILAIRQECEHVIPTQATRSIVSLSRLDGGADLQLMHRQVRTAAVYSTPLVQKIASRALAAQDYEPFAEYVEIHDISWKL